MVSVVTPLYNSSRHIDATLQSLVAQTFGDWEAILVDDGSTDDTPQRVRPFLADDRFTYVRQANQGIGAARNRGIGLARGAWVALLDHDDRWRSDKLERQLAAAAEHGWDVVCSDAEVVRASGRTLYSSYLHDHTLAALRRPDTPGVDLYALLIRMNFLCASTVLLRRGLFAEHGLLDAAVAPADDYDMWLRCAATASLGYVDEPLVAYVLHETNHSWDNTRMHDAALRVLLRVLPHCRGDERRTAACLEALTVHSAVLLREYERDCPRLARHVVRLVRHGVQGLRVLRRSWRIRHQVRTGF